MDLVYHSRDDQILNKLIGDQTRPAEWVDPSAEMNGPPFSAGCPFSPAMIPKGIGNNHGVPQTLTNLVFSLRINPGWVSAPESLDILGAH
jgi:hypothetical protein